MLSQESHRIALPVFEGPLDLLLHLIKKEDLDIQSIPIAEITRQYLDYLQLAGELDMDLAGEFLDMAAELAYIKSRLLLPELKEEEEGPDPRADLVAKLLEYKKYKLAAEVLVAKPMLGRDVFRRPTGNQPTEESQPVIDVDALTLLAFFQGLLKRLPRERSQEVTRRGIGVAERILELMTFLRTRETSLFEAFFEEDRTREQLIATLLALLEMARQRLVRVVQEGLLGPIVVVRLFSDEGENGEVDGIETTH